MKSYTDIEQSRKLAEILPVESADMTWVEGEWGEPIVGKIIKSPDEDYTFIPCWSLAALLGVMPKGEGKDLSLVFGSYDGDYHPLWSCTYEEMPTIVEICDADDLIDACIEMIYKLKEKNLI